MSSILDEIVASKRREVADLPALNANANSPPGRDFLAALRGRCRAVIAELKPRSPSAGTLCASYKPSELALQYEEGGAAAISVLTDRAYFGGEVEHLKEARNAVSLPVLRKDFIVDERQVAESRRIGADACLLIVAALKLQELAQLHTAILRTGMSALVEVHDERELAVALDIGARMVGVNHRDLRTMRIDPRATERMLHLVPDDVVLVAESGFTDPKQVQDLPDRVNGVLIGTALMRSPNPAQFIRRTQTSAEPAA